MTHVLFARAAELVHHDVECKHGGRGDEYCTCDAVPFLRDLKAYLGDGAPLTPSEQFGAALTALPGLAAAAGCYVGVKVTAAK
jgi:hypothetical protein